MSRFIQEMPKRRPEKQVKERKMPEPGKYSQKDLEKVGDTPWLRK